MYIPTTNAIHDESEIRAFVAAVGVAQLVTTGDDGTPAATLLPVEWVGDRLVTHAARRNQQWATLAARALPVRALAVVTGPDAYVSPTWYAGREVHRRTVPTWDYSTVHLAGTLTTFEDIDRLADHVTSLSARHEDDRKDGWVPAETPDGYMAGMLRGIIGIELAVESVEARAKLSQNRPAEDRAGVVAGLRGEGSISALDVADQLEAGTWLPGRGRPDAGWAGPGSGALPGSADRPVTGT